MYDFFQKPLNLFTNNITNFFKKNENEEKEKNININYNEYKKVNKITIIVGSTNFYFIFNDERETIPVLILFRGDKVLYGTKVIEKITGHKYLDNALILFDFLYYLDIKFEVLKDSLIKRNLFNNNLKYIDENKDKIFFFNYMFLSSSKEEEEKDFNQKLNREVKKDNQNKIFPSVSKPKVYTLLNKKIINLESFTSKDLLNLYITNIFEEKLNNLKEEYFVLQLILPLYLNDIQKAEIKYIFQTILNEKNLNKNLIDFIVKDEMNYYLENINKNLENKIIFIHFGGSSLVVVLYDYDNKKIIKKEEKLIGGIDIDIMFTTDCLTKFKNDNNGCSIMDISLIYKVKNEIEEEKKKLYLNNKLNIKIEKFKYGLTLKYEMDKDYLLIAIGDIITEINNILKNILKNVNKDEIKNVIYTGNNFKFKIFEEILYDYFPKNICEHIYDEELNIF